MVATTVVAMVTAVITGTAMVVEKVTAVITGTAMGDPTVVEKETGVERALRNNRRVAVTGPLRAGKSTMIQFLVLKMCRENMSSNEPGNIPVPVPLWDFIGAKKGLGDHVFYVFERYGVRGAKKFVERALIMGKCTLLLDGFDAFLTPGERDRIVREIGNFSEKYPECPILVTCPGASWT